MEEEGIEPSDDNGVHSPRMGFRGWVFSFGYVALMLLGLGLHLFTLLIAYSAWGLLAAGATFCFPVFSQIFWFIAVWYYQGTPFTGYGIAVIGYFALSSIFLSTVGLWSDANTGVDAG